MPEFHIPCSWLETGTIHVEAENLEDAINKAGDEELPRDDCEYSDGSFEINYEWALEVNRELITKLEEEKKNPINNIIKKAFPDGH